MNVFINKVHFPVYSLGPGRRIGIWFQGCSIACAGCLSRDTWTQAPHHEVALNDLVCITRKHILMVNGITISGGEPFQQPRALEAFLAEITTWRTDDHDFDVLIYSGLSESFLRRKYLSILEYCDALVPEPFRKALSPASGWRGSMNQPLVVLSDRGARVYAHSARDERAAKPQAVHFLGDTFIIGVPSDGMLEQFESELATRGLRPLNLSWRL